MADEDESAEDAQQPHPGGRPANYDPSMCVLAHELSQEGATDFEIAQALEIHESTFYRWRAKYPEFRESLKLGKQAADERVERSLYHRAVGYSHRAVKIMQNNGVPMVVPYTEHVPPDVGAVTLWLTNRKGDEWRSKQALEHTGKDGGAIELKSTIEFVDAPQQPGPVSEEA